MTQPKGATTAMVEALAQPTPKDRVQWRGDHTTKDKSRISVLGYVDARFVMDRLDATVLPENWQTRFEDIPGGVRCGIGVLVNDEWVWKWDAHPHTDIESVKGGHSKALVRAAVHWGIARDLYDLPDLWVDARETYPGSGKYEPAVLPTLVDGQWTTPSRGGREASSARPAAPIASINGHRAGNPPAGPAAHTSEPPPLFDEPEFKPIGGESPADVPTDVCPIHGTRWIGDPPDQYHGPKGIVPTGYCRHPANVKRPAAARR